MLNRAVVAAEATVPPTVALAVGAPEPVPGAHRVVGAVGQPVASDGYWARSSRACKVLVGAVGETTSAVGVVLVIRMVQGAVGVEMSPLELTQASTELASVLMSVCGTIAVALVGGAELATPVVVLTRFAAFRKACAKPEAAQAVVALLTTVQAAVASLLFAGALMFTVVPLTVMKPLSA